MSNNSNNRISIFNVEGMTCAACASSSQKILSRTEGVKSARVNFATSTAIVEWQNPDAALTVAQLNAKLQKAGYTLYPKNAHERLARQKAAEKEEKRFKIKVLVSAILALPLFVLGMFVPHNTLYVNEIMLVLTLPLLFWTGNQFFIKAFYQLRNGSTNMDVLVALGTGIAFGWSVVNTFAANFLLQHGIHPYVYYETVGILLTFLLIGKYIEQRAQFRSRSAMESLLDLQPQEVNWLDENTEKRVPVEAVQENDLLVVKPGEKVPLDGIIVEGSSEIDESTFTGESLPVTRKAGDEVKGGSINHSGSFKMQVSKIGEQTLLSQLIRLVEQAQSSQAPVQRLADRISAIFVPAVLLLSVAAFLVWWLAAGNLPNAIQTAIAVLVVACPCALGLATPTAMVVGIGHAAQKGILIKNAEVLENAQFIDTVLLDKTGTITEGHPAVMGAKWQFLLVWGIGNMEQTLLSLENCSTHPLARTLVKVFQQQGIVPEKTVTEFKNHPGLGISGVIDGQQYYAGNRRWMLELGVVATGDITDAAQSYEEEAFTVVWFANDKTVLGLVAFSDALKPSSKFAIQRLLSSGKKVVMLTGDNEQVARAVARQTGITEYQAGVLPADKIACVRQLQNAGKRVAMVGDGINDAPALAQANIGIAMNKGTDIAMESASVVLLHNDLQDIETLIQISRLTLQTVRQNLFWAFFYNALSLPIAMGALYPIFHLLLNPMIAGVAMSLSSITVVFNSLRLKKQLMGK